MADPGPDPRVAGVGDVRLPANSVEPVVGVAPALWVARLSNPDADQGRPVHQHRQWGSAIPSEGTSLPLRLPGTHLHPQLRRPQSAAGPSPRADSPA
ncbi:MAG: hypothetical protein ACRDRX_13895 [Pseudonocardiaceae bacterium]